MGQIKNIKLHIVTDIKIITQITNMGYLKVTQPGDWIPVLEQMVKQLQQQGFHRGQIYSIDVHNNGPDADGIVSAHWTGQPVGYGGTAYIGFELLNDTNSWHNHYSWASESGCISKSRKTYNINFKHSELKW